MENCFRFLEEVGTTVAIRVFSLTILFKLAQHYPDITRELKIIIDDNQDHQSPAFKSRAGKLLTML